MSEARAPSRRAVCMFDYSEATCLGIAPLVVVCEGVWMRTEGHRSLA